MKASLNRLPRRDWVLLREEAEVERDTPEVSRCRPPVRELSIAARGVERGVAMTESRPPSSALGKTPGWSGRSACTTSPGREHEEASCRRGKAGETRAWHPQSLDRVAVGGIVR
jgi:hypothetical protein